MDAFHLAVPRLVRVAECEHITGRESNARGHLEAEVVGTILGPVERVQRRRAVHEHQSRPRGVTALRSNVHREGQGTKGALRLAGHGTTRVLVTDVRQRLLARCLALAAAVLVVRRDGRVVVAGNPADAPQNQALHHLVRMRGIPDEITKVKNRIRVSTAVDVGEHRVQRMQVRVNVGDEGVAHGGSVRIGCDGCPARRDAVAP